MLITRTSLFTGEIHVMDLNITQEQVENYARGALIQDAFPNLTATEREFYKTGITPEEWDDANCGDDFPPEFDPNYDEDIAYFFT